MGGLSCLNGDKGNKEIETKKKYLEELNKQIEEKEKELTNLKKSETFISNKTEELNERKSNF